MLITDNEILIRAAKRNYDNFPVPTKLVDSTMKDRKYTSEEQADLDIKTSINKIGEIINLSQELNSLLWDRINKGANIEDVMDLYCDIAQLDVMSNLEIDSAKRENPANNTYELQCLKRKYDQRDNKDRHIRPLFFKYIDGYKGYRDDYYIYKETEDDGFSKCCVIEKRGDALQYKNNSDDIIHIERGRMSYQKYETAMDYLQLSINKFRTCRLSKKELLTFSECLIPMETLCGYVKYPQVEKIIENIRETKKKISSVWINENELSNRKKREISQEVRQECIDYISSLIIGQKTMRYLLSIIDKKEFSDVSKFLFDTLFGTANECFYDLIQKSQETIYRLEECENGDIDIYNFSYNKVKNL